MIGELMPPGVAAEEAFTDPETVELLPEEEVFVAKAVPKRRHEFATVRACARKALAELGHPPVPLLPGERGAPGWPAGIVGSMTHCAGYRAAVVAPEGVVRSLGIDAEPHLDLPDGVLDAVSSEDERRHLADLGRDRPEICWDRLLFSAKESVYKTWFPLTGRWLGFEDARVRFDPRAGTFRAQILVDGSATTGPALTGFEGRWLVRDGLLITSIVLLPEA